MNSQLYHAHPEKAQRPRQLDSCLIKHPNSGRVCSSCRIVNRVDYMEPELTSSAASNKLLFIFYNDRGLRAGWRLLIYCGMIFVLVEGATLIARRLSSGQPKKLSSSDFIQTI